MECVFADRTAWRTTLWTKRSASLLQSTGENRVHVHLSVFVFGLFDSCSEADGVTVLLDHSRGGSCRKHRLERLDFDCFDSFFMLTAGHKCLTLMLKQRQTLSSCEWIGNTDSDISNRAYSSFGNFKTRDNKAEFWAVEYLH